MSLYKAKTSDTLSWTKLQRLQVCCTNEVQSYSFVGEKHARIMSIVQFEALSKPLTPTALRWNLSKFVVLKHFGPKFLH